ncbi:MAG: ABC transporter ATP-binding protein/permease [Bacteroidetes bacterium]|nr:ABC transporter ATP-binding protein/permease [Bacteroidota bacterium]
MAKTPFWKQLDWSLLRRVLRIAAPFRSLLWISAFLTIMQGLMVGLQPYLIQQTLDVQVANRDVPGIARMSLILLALVLFQALITFLSGYFSARAGQEVVRTLRNYVFEHLVALRMKFYDKTPVGTLVTRTISDIETIADLFSAGLITIAGDIFQLLVILSFMLWMNWKLTLISLSVLPLLLYAAQKFRIGVRDSFQEVRAQVARLNAFVQERITGMQVVQLFHREYAEYGRFERINREHREAHVKGVFYYSVFFPVVELIVALTFALLVWYGAKGMLEGTVAFGEITAFILFINLFFRPVRAVADRFNNIQMGLVAVERIFKLMDETENREQDGTLDATGIKGEIAFDHVHFAYEPSTPVLHDLSFYLEPGKTLAIVGPTGAGKTSIIGLLSRFYEHQEGRILLDGTPIESYKLDSLRSRIAVVLQDVFLFSGSVFDNMRMKDQDISEEKVAEVARAIGAYDFIEQLPGGFSFNVMERGSSLSVGQRQLISFIRALSTDPAVIILDEATSSVDSETEALIQKAITTMLQGRTGIVIAHRLSTIKHADYIMVLDHGRCVQWGTHEQLIKQEGMYQTLYRSQFGKSAVEV